MARALVSAWVFVQIELMVRLCIPPLTRRQDLGNNLPTLPPLLLNLLRDLLCLLLLLCIVIEDATSVLRSGVWSLTVVGCGIVHFVEEFDQCGVADFTWVVGYLKGFCVC